MGVSLSKELLSTWKNEMVWYTWNPSALRDLGGVKADEGLVHELLFKEQGLVLVNYRVLESRGTLEGFQCVF